MKYRLFLKKCERQNREFVKLMEKYSLVEATDYILETASHSEYSLSEFLKNENKTVIESSFGKLTVMGTLRESLVLSSNTCYISNGVYEDTEAIARNLFGYGSFAIGICADKNSPIFRETKIKLEKLKTELNTLKKNEKIKIYRDRGKYGNTFILSYRGDRL